MNNILDAKQKILIKEREAKKIAGESNAFGDLVESCIVYCGWRYHKESGMWFVAGSIVAGWALYLAVTSSMGLVHVKNMMESLGQIETYKFIELTWGYSSPLIKFESMKWFSETIQS